MPQTKPLPSLQFYLASRSPRRVQMLRDLGYAFETLSADIDETPLPDESPRAFALRMAASKAGAATPPLPLPVIGADTDVSVDGRILGKPADRDDALRMLSALSGRAHQVCSAVALRRGERLDTALSVTEVVFGDIGADEAEAYWNSGEPADKAGAYAIQGGAARWIKEIRGSYTGVVGLPLYETVNLLKAAGITPHAPR